MKQKLTRWSIYLVGTVILAFGLTLNTKTSLGTSCVMSIPYAVSQLWPISMGNATLVVFLVFILIQMALHIRLARKTGARVGKLLVLDGLQVVQNLVFSRLVGLYSVWIPMLEQRWPQSFLGSIWGRGLAMALAIVCVGLGAAMTLNMRLVPNPGDGIVQVVADTIGKPVGFTKNWVDGVCVCGALILGLAVEGRVIGIGVGTLIAALLTGRVITLVNRLWKGKMCAAAGVRT